MRALWIKNCGSNAQKAKRLCHKDGLTATRHWATLFAGKVPMKKPKLEIIKTTVRLPKSVWRAVQHIAIDEDVSAESIVVRALGEYIKTFIKPKRGKS